MEINWEYEYQRLLESAMQLNEMFTKLKIEYEKIKEMMTYQ